jgi:hypothetical protein
MNAARIRGYCLPRFCGREGRGEGLFESRPQVDLPALSTGFSIKTSAKRSDVRPLALSPEYRGEGKIIPYPCDVQVKNDFPLKISR